MNNNLENKVYEKIGTNIKTARTLKNMTQEHLAEQLKKIYKFCKPNRTRSNWNKC